MQLRKAAIIGACLAAISLLAAWYLTGRPVTDEPRYAELQRLGSTYKMALTVGPRLPDRLAALLHFRSLTNYLRSRFEEQEEALVSSGYLVKVKIPVHNLQAKRVQVCTTLSNTWVRTGAYYVLALDWTRDEVRLLCRKEDISLWQRALGTVDDK